LIEVFRSNSNHILKIFQTLSSNLFDLNLWTNVQISIFEKVQKISFKFKFPFEPIHFSCQKFEIHLPIYIMHSTQSTAPAHPPSAIWSSSALALWSSLAHRDSSPTLSHHASTITGQQRSAVPACLQATQLVSAPPLPKWVPPPSLP
jgi:hypothetical protein